MVLPDSNILSRQVEVLWCRGTKRLDPLFPLLVKGHNLYKLKTFRQRWKNEKERLEVLAEKHKRGAAARSIRALRRTKAMVKTNKSSKCKGSKRRKYFHHVGPSGTRETTHMKKNCVNEHRNAVAKNKQQNPRKNSTPFQTLSSKQDGGLRGPASCRRHQNPIHFPYNNPSQTFNHLQSDVFPRELHHFPSCRGSASTARLPSSYCFPFMFPSLFWNVKNLVMTVLLALVIHILRMHMNLESLAASLDEQTTTHHFTWQLLRCMGGENMNKQGMWTI